MSEDRPVLQSQDDNDQSEDAYLSQRELDEMRWKNDEAGLAIILALAIISVFGIMLYISFLLHGVLCNGN